MHFKSIFDEVHKHLKGKIGINLNIIREKKRISMTIMDIQTQNIRQILSKTSNSSKSFGILNGKIKDPIKWQKAIREESDRDIYKNKFSEFVGIWKDRDITQESIREQAWR